MVKELNTFSDNSVPHTDHVLSHVLYEWEKAALGIEPRVGVELFGDRLEGFDDTADTEIVVALGAVKSADD